MRSMFARTVTIVLAALAAGACGGSSGVTAPPPPSPPPPPVQRVIAQGASSGLEPRNLVYLPFTTNSAGNLAVTVDWTFASNDVDIFVTHEVCTVDQINGGTCSMLAASTSPTAKPEKLAIGGLPAGSYVLFIGNHGPTTESISYQILLTTGGTASSAGVASASAATRLRQPMEGLAPVQ